MRLAQKYNVILREIEEVDYSLCGAKVWVLETLKVVWVGLLEKQFAFKTLMPLSDVHFS